MDRSKGQSGVSYYSTNWQGPIAFSIQVAFLGLLDHLFDFVLIETPRIPNFKPWYYPLGSKFVDGGFTELEILAELFGSEDF